MQQNSIITQQQTSGYLLKPNIYKSINQDKSDFFEYVAVGMQGWRNTMEDAHLSLINIKPNCHLFAIFDGHGGQQVAKFAQAHFTKELLNNKNFQFNKIEDALKETFLKIDQMLQSQEYYQELLQYTLNQNPQEVNNSGCTANVLLIYNNSEIYCANAGDSRTVLCNGGVAIELSKDHNPEQPKELERIQKAGGFIYQGRVNGQINLSRSLGDLEFKSNPNLKPEEQLLSPMPDIRKKKLSPDDQFIIMGCDGIWEIHTNDEIVNLISKKLQEQQKIEKIMVDFLDQCISQDSSSGVGCDNMTSILIKFNKKYN